MKPYPAYKPTGLAWLPEVPRGWNCRKFKYLFSERSEKGFPNEPLLAATQNHGVILKTEYENRTVTAEKGLETLKLVKVGDFVISLRSFEGGIELSYRQGIISPAYTIIFSNGELTNGYFKWLGKSAVFIQLLKTCVTGIREGQNIDYGRLRVSGVPITPPAEQEAIVAYLDEKTAKIDRLIELKEREIKLLNEKKQAVISKVVTRGLDPNAELVDSGVDWIGKVPRGWRMYRLRHTAAARFEYGANSSGVDYQEDLPRYIRITDIDSNGNLKDEGKLSLGATEAVDYALEDGDILFARSGGTVGKSFLYKCSYGQCCYAGYLIRYRPDKAVVLPEYAYAFTNSSLYAFWLSRIFIQATIQNVSAERYKNLQIPIPPLPEQREIVAYLDAEGAKTDKAIAAVTRQIGLLREYRTRLISDAVTGRIDLRKL